VASRSRYCEKSCRPTAVERVWCVVGHRGHPMFVIAYGLTLACLSTLLISSVRYSPPSPASKSHQGNTSGRQVEKILIINGSQSQPYTLYFGSFLTFVLYIFIISIYRLQWSPPESSRTPPAILCRTRHKNGVCTVHQCVSSLLVS